MKEKSLEGKRYLNWVRCSSSKQSDTSLADQLTLLNAFAVQHKMVHVDDVLVDGVTGSIPGARRDVDELIYRKQTRNDFHVVLLHDTSRLTRAGNTHGAKVEWELRVAGIQVVFVNDDIPDNEFGDIYKSMLYVQAKKQAQVISFTSTRGLMSALQDGRTAYCKSPPYAIDKLIVAPDGTPRHILRLRADGTQLQLHPDTLAVIAEFKRDEKTGKSEHYIKQKQERVILIPGATEHVEIVRRIYARHYRDGAGAPLIARELNDDSVPAARGGQWHVEQVRQILLNPIYCGVSYANFSSAAIYHMRAPNAPQSVDMDTALLANRKRPPRRIRPRTDWIEQEHAALQDLLEPDIRELARRRQEGYLQQKAEGHVPDPDRNRHKQSAYILSGILTTRHGGLKMTGCVSGTAPKLTRYYRVARAKSAPTSDPVLSKRVPAEPLEHAVVALLQHVLTWGNFLERDVRAAVERANKRASRSPDALARLRKQRAAAVHKLNFAIANLDPTAQDAARETLSRLQKTIHGLDEKIRQVESTTDTPLDAATLVARVTGTLSDIGNRIHELPPAALRRLIGAFITRAEIDTETRHVNLEIRLPKCALGASESMGFDPMLPWLSWIETHGDRDCEHHTLILRPMLLCVPETKEYGVVDFAGAA